MQLFHYLNICLNTYNIYNYYFLISLATVRQSCNFFQLNFWTLQQ
jgi:hypothetical protein